jgi:hypothetical protein
MSAASCCAAVAVLCVSAAASYCDEGIYLSIFGVCGPWFQTGAEVQYLSAVFAFPKKALYTKPASKVGPSIMRATYTTATWFYSLPPEDQALNFDDGNPAFNNYVLPARPQTERDCSEPHFVMGKVSRLPRWYQGDAHI